MFFIFGSASVRIEVVQVVFFWRPAGGTSDVQVAQLYLGCVVV